MTLRELLEQERDRAADIQCVMPRSTHDADDYRKYWFAEGANHFIGLLWPCVEALEKYRGQASRQQKGPTFYSEADEAFAEIQRRLREGMNK